MIAFDGACNYGRGTLNRIIILVALVVAGCATVPVVDFATPESISIRYDAFLVNPREAGNVAQQHCQKYEKNAAIIDRSEDSEGWSIMSFDCR